MRSINVCACSVTSDSCRLPWTVACEAPLFMGFSKQEYWSGLSFLPPRSDCFEGYLIPLNLLNHPGSRVSPHFRYEDTEVQRGHGIWPWSQDCLGLPNPKPLLMTTWINSVTNKTPNYRSKGAWWIQMILLRGNLAAFHLRKYYWGKHGLGKCDHKLTEKPDSFCDNSINFLIYSRTTNSVQAC